MRSAAVIVALLLSCLSCLAQDADSTAHPSSDTTLIKSGGIQRTSGKRVVNIDTYAARFNPRKALFYSAILPGAGQSYNKKYWKVPLVYGGFIGLLAVVKFYNDANVKYTNLTFQIINDPSSIPTGATYSSYLTQVRNAQDQAQRQRDYFSIFVGLFYILQLVDAHVDAHLKEFDLNPQLHVRIQPVLSPAQVGAAIQFRF